MDENRYKWGYHVKELNRAADETRNILIDVARREGTISYTDLCRKIKSISVEPDSHALAHNLGRSRHEKTGKGTAC